MIKQNFLPILKSNLLVSLGIKMCGLGVLLLSELINIVFIRCKATSVRLFMDFILFYFVYGPFVYATRMFMDLIMLLCTFFVIFFD